MSVEEWAQGCPACGSIGYCEHRVLGECMARIEVLNKRITELEEFRTKANARIHRLSDALDTIVYRYESRKMCNCDLHGRYTCDGCIAKAALEGKP